MDSVSIYAMIVLISDNYLISK